MSINTDINLEKSELRKKFIALRNSVLLEEKKKKDTLILENLKKLPEVKNADIILTYISVNSEADTKNAINYFLKENKKVAAAKCLEKYGEMDFYFIKSLADLKNGKFNIPEPCSDCEKFIRENFKDKKIICFVPGLSFTEEGFRLGYGGGYYDRFLSVNSNIISIGLCSEDFISKSLPCGKYDMSVDIVITDRKIRK